MFTCGLKESMEKKVELNDVSATVFKAILTYIYTGVFEVKDALLASMTDYIAAAHLYQMDELAHGIAEYLKEGLAVKNVIDRYKTADLYQLDELKQTCLSFMDDKAADVLKSEAFLGLSKVLKFTCTCLQF
jgi:hypothetical protein